MERISYNSLIKNLLKRSHLILFHNHNQVTRLIFANIAHKSHQKLIKKKLQ
jgi:hypothetical protein